MVIGIDIRVLGNRFRSGVEEYTENLLAHLLPLDKKIKFKLFYSSFRNDLSDYDWLHLSNVELIKLKFPNRLLFASNYLVNKPYIDKLSGGVDLFFFTPSFFIVFISPM